MEIKNKGGRPPKGQMTRTARINLRAEPGDKTRYEKAAAKADLSLSDWIKNRLDRAASRELRD
jgi:predicted HicB family RNase H-like nuclease